MMTMRLDEPAKAGTRIELYAVSGYAETTEIILTDYIKAES